MIQQFRIIKLVSFLTFLCVVGFPSAYLLFDIKQHSLVQSTTQNFINDIKLAQESAIKSNNVISVSAIDDDWNKGWSISSNQQGHIKTSFIDTSVSLNNSKIKKILFRPSGITHVLQPLGDAGFFICDKEGQGNQLTMIASGFIRVKNIKQNCLA